MNNLIDIENVPPNPDDPEDVNYNENNGEPEVLYWAFGSKWQEVTTDDIDEMAEDEEEFRDWLVEYLKEDVEMAETMLACMVVKNDPDNGNYTIALWTEGNINVESNDGEKRSVEHAVEIVLTEEVSEFFNRSLEIIENALNTATVIVDKYSEEARNAGVNLQLLADLTSDPNKTMDKIKQAVADPKEYLK